MFNDALSLGAGIRGREVIVTGVAGGIGGQVGRLVAEAGGIVLGMDLPGERLDAAIAALPGDEHRAVPVNLADAESIEPTVRDNVRVDRFRGIVHAAAFLRRKDPATVTPQDWDDQVDVNVKATFFLNRVVGDLLIEGGNGGRIINFSSVAWMTGPWMGSDVYVATKGAVVSLTKGFVRRLGPYGITVNVIAPGQIDTEMQRKDNTDEVIAAGIAANPLGRMGQPEEVAAAALFLLSDHASFVSGVTMNVSGGTLLY